MLRTRLGWHTDRVSTPEMPVTYTMSIAWPEAQVSVQPANQFAATIGVPGADGAADSVYVTIGHVSPPFLSGTPEDLQEKLASYGPLAVDTLARYVVSRARLQEFIDVLQRVADIYDHARGDSSDDHASGSS